MIHHVQLACPPGGEGASRAFYQDVLGLDEIPKPVHGSGRQAAAGGRVQRATIAGIGKISDRG